LTFMPRRHKNYAEKIFEGYQMKMSRTKKTTTLRFGVIGLGGMGQKYCKVLGKMPRVALTAVCDAFAGAAENTGKTFNVPFFTDHRALIRARCCDVVAIVTPHPFHAQPAIDCMRAGIHVVTEKPLTERVATADKMIQAARANGVVFAVMFQLRLDLLWRQALEIVKSGMLGRIYRTTMLEMKYRSQRYYDSGVWRATWKGEGGGVLINQAPHMIDMFVQLAGVPSEVLGKTETRMHRIEVEDHAEALLKYKNGARGYLCCSTNEPESNSLIELSGDKGRLTIRDNKLEFYAFSPPLSKHLKETKDIWDKPQVNGLGPAELPKLKALKFGGHEAVLRNMVNHVLDGEPLATPGASGLGSLELANAITLSSHEDRWIKLPIDRKKYDQLLFKLQRESRFVKKNVKVECKTDPKLA